MTIRHIPSILLPATALCLAAVISASASAPEPGTHSANSAEPVPGRVLFQLTSDAFTSGDLHPKVGITGRTGLAALDQQLAALGTYEVIQAFDLEPNRAAKTAVGLDRIFVANFDTSVDPNQAVEILVSLPEIEYAEPDGMWRILLAPNDPLYPDQWAHDNTGQAIDYDGDPVGTPDCDTDTDQAWDLQTGDPNLIVAIIDTGCDLNHPEYSSRIVQGYDFVNDDWDPSPVGSGVYFYCFETKSRRDTQSVILMR